MMFPIRVNDRDRDRDRNNKPPRKTSSTSTSSTSKTKKDPSSSENNNTTTTTTTHNHHHHHHRSSHGRSSRNSTRDRDRDASTATASTSSRSSTTKRRRSSVPMPMPTVEDADGPAASATATATPTASVTASFLESRTSLPYPTFSKAHSKEVVGKTDIPTPDPTDVTAVEGRESVVNQNRTGTDAAAAAATDTVTGTKTETTTTTHDDGRDPSDNNHNNHNNNHSHQTPPSPPLTNVDQQPSRKGSTNGETTTKDEKITSAEEKEKEKEKEKTNSKDGKTRIRIRAKSTKSLSSLREKKDTGKKSTDTSPKSRVRHEKKDGAPSRTASYKSSKSTLREHAKLPKRSTSHEAMSPATSNVTVRNVASDLTAKDSSATSVAPSQQSTTYQKPMTPPLNPPSRTQSRSSMSSSVPYSPGNNGAYDYGRPPTSGSMGYGAPPPPPPPPEMPVSIPRVDYLLRLGGLDDMIPKTLLAAGAEPDMPYPAAQPQILAASVFEPFNQLLDDYQKVMHKNGSLAVATGYRSVARRLLDRLEAVFARDISSESCRCLMCDYDGFEEERPSGVSWGEVLELVSGRKELPGWPPFAIAPSVIDPELSSEEHIPMQKLDIDVPEEYREHYIRQSRKTKVAVDKWLSEQTVQATSSPPDEIDDETLTFAMLTRLEPEQRPIFCALLGIRPTTPVPKSDSPQQQPRSRPSALVSSALAIQRLYRLSSPPRDPETAIYMLNNPGIHHVLATLAAISNDEWDILISGRFDGFLRSGAEEDLPSAGSIPSRWASRSSTPFTAGGAGISRGATPNHMDGTFRPWSQPSMASSTPTAASFGGPIALDEETEIAALAEIEREIFLGMEALEDAFEALHGKAELVRRALRERGAGLAVANQSRRGTYVEARLGTPASGLGGVWESGTEDDGIDDDRSLYPDDSASNISSNRRRRPRRRSERRTPAPVEEEDEDAVEGLQSGGSRRERGNWRR